MIAALYVERGGVYWNLAGVDPWDISRDARRYPGSKPVVAHPPCSAWCQIAYVNQKRYGRRVGDDSGCFAAALTAVRRWGGVLEHPALSYAWPAHNLMRPRFGIWTRDLIDEGWVTEVHQSAYGHPARKATWLYYIGPYPPDLDWSSPEPTATVSYLSNHGGLPRPRLTTKQAKATPPAFRDLLLSLARRSVPMEATA